MSYFPNRLKTSEDFTFNTRIREFSASYPCRTLGQKSHENARTNSICHFFQNKVDRRPKFANNFGNLPEGMKNADKKDSHLCGGYFRGGPDEDYSH